MVVLDSNEKISEAQTEIRAFGTLKLDNKSSSFTMTKGEGGVDGSSSLGEKALELLRGCHAPNPRDAEFQCWRLHTVHFPHP